MKSCGGCAECCHLLAVEELAKPACQWCSEVKSDPYTGRSCGIYASRPESCRIFQCLWTLDPKMVPELRPDRCGVIFAMDDYLSGPYDADKPRLYVIVDPKRSNAWRRKLPMTAIQTMLKRGGEVIVQVENWWRHYHDSVCAEGTGDFGLGVSLGMFRLSGTLPPGMPSAILDFEKLMQNG